ncbi:MAG: translation initiation factor IF-3 C-terminal domain-containing protein [Fibromonadaceae bacterium]|nr:translation initiation factor IF-3 C-terminal domain-containing protein [Fibromonadaceae bacterium]
MLPQVIHSVYCRFFFAMLATVASLMACTQQPSLNFQNVPPANPNAPLAWLGEGNMGKKMQIQYAEALQSAGIFNFAPSEFSEEQIEKAVEIRMHYKEESGKYNRIPVLHLKAEFLEDGNLKFKFEIREKSNEIVTSLRNRKREIAFRQTVLMQRFLEELKRSKAVEKDANHRG